MRWGIDEGPPKKGKKSAMVRDRYSVIVGTGRYVPSEKILNQDFIGNEFYKGYEEAIDPTTNSTVLERFKGITEISERRYVTADQVASDIAAPLQPRSRQCPRPPDQRSHIASRRSR